jgi:hypothetical protein
MQEPAKPNVSDQAKAGNQAGAIVTLAICGLVALALLVRLAVALANSHGGWAAGMAIGSAFVLAFLWWSLAGPAIRRLRQ